MSTANEITRLTSARNKLRTKAVALGIGTNTDKLDVIADEFDAIVDRGAVSATIQEGDTYTIQAGYHDGSGTVSAVAGGGNYSLQNKGPITPTKSQQSVTADQGYYGLSGVTIAAIPEAYQDVQSVTATAAHVLANDVFVDAEGNVIAGTMPNNGAVAGTVTPAAPVYTIPAGFHSGLGTVTATTETKTATPTKNQQTISPTTGKFLSSVTVEAIPADYQDVSNVDATAADVLAGKIIVLANGTEVTGTMVDRGTVTQTLDATTGKQSYTIPAGKHSGSGTVSITLEEKTAAPTKSSQNITPTAGKVLSKVTVAAIPAAYQDVTNVDATAADVLVGKTIVVSNGTEVEGTMPNAGTVTQTLDATTGKQSYTIPAGKHSGSGTVSITLEEKSATPTTSSQNITPTTGKVLSKVTVAAIPAKYGDTTGDDGVAADVLIGKKVHTIVNGVATLITGTMTNNGSIAATIDGLTTTSYTIPAGKHSGSGIVSLTDDIELALAAI